MLRFIATRILSAMSATNSALPPISKYRLPVYRLQLYQIDLIKTTVSHGSDGGFHSTMNIGHPAPGTSAVSSAAMALSRALGNPLRSSKSPLLRVSCVSCANLGHVRHQLGLIGVGQFGHGAASPSMHRGRDPSSTETDKHRRRFWPAWTMRLEGRQFVEPDLADHRACDQTVIGFDQILRHIGITQATNTGMQDITLSSAPC